MKRQRQIKIENVTGGYIISSNDEGLIQRFPIEGEIDSEMAFNKIKHVLGGLILKMTEERNFTLTVEDDFTPDY